MLNFFMGPKTQCDIEPQGFIIIYIIYYIIIYSIKVSVSQSSEDK